MPHLPHLRPLDAVRALVVTGRPDPRVLQVVLAVLVALDFLIRWFGTRDLHLDGWPGLGLLVLALVTVVSLAVPWHRLPANAVGVLPVVDIAALGAVRMAPDSGAGGILVVIPALWLGRQFGRAGAGVAVLAVALLAALPRLLLVTSTVSDVSRAVLITVVAGWSALAIAYGLERIRTERDEAQRRGVELARAMSTIEEQRRTSEAIFDAVDVGLLLLDAEGRYRGHNQRHEDFLDLAYPGGHGGRAGQTGAAYDADGVTPLTSERAPTSRATRGEEFEDRRIWVGADPLTRRALSVSARSLRARDGSFAGAALAYKDVTDLMRALAVKEDFVASVSHELRTPLTSITGYVQMLLEREDLPPGVPAQLRIVDRNADRLLRLIADLLHSAQAAVGTIRLDRERCDLAGVVRDAVELAEPAARDRGVAVEARLPGELWLQLDPLRIAQVVDNLVSNAVKYTPEGGSVTVRLGVDGDRAELAVTDTGIGIAAADRGLLFDRFFRTRQAEQQAVQGVGLGLSITRDLVESHGGRIEVESTLGEGSTFRVRLPLDAGGAAAQPAS